MTQIVTCLGGQGFGYQGLENAVEGSSGEALRNALLLSLLEEQDCCPTALLTAADSDDTQFDETGDFLGAEDSVTRIFVAQLSSLAAVGDGASAAGVVPAAFAGYSQGVAEAAVCAASTGGLSFGLLSRCDG